MRARLVRLAFATHRWLGVLLGPLMLMWCLSGLVMIWVSYPSMTGGGRDLRTEGLVDIELDAPPVFPTEIPANARVTNARLEMLANRPVLHLRWSDRNGLFDLRNGSPVTEIREREALQIARIYASQHGKIVEPEIKQLSDYDEFTVAGFHRAAGPYWQVRLRDDAGTMLYISSKTGEVRQRTTRALRVWNWLGAIPHWLYFTELRKDGQLWSDVVIWTSLAGCFLVSVGSFVGLRQFRSRTSTGGHDSPYRGAKRWHHFSGLFAGVLLLLWSFSGFASMQPWGWLTTGEVAAEAAGRLPGRAPTWGVVQTNLVNQISAIGERRGGVRQISSARHDGVMNFMWRRADGGLERRAPTGATTSFESEDWVRTAELLSGGSAFSVEMLETEDEYYYKGAAAGRLPVLRVTTLTDQTRYYVDPESLQVVAIADDGAKGFRWFHLALHRIDFASWIRTAPLRELVIILFLFPATLISATGAWIGLKKLGRWGRLEGRPPRRA